MPNQITSAGLETATYAELVAEFTTAFEEIYGADIILTSDSPDGQMMGIFIQAVLDLEDLLTQLNASFDPDQAIGVILDQRVALNGLERKGGTYTIQNVNITVTEALTLPGLDQTDVPVFTVADSAGTQWQLIVSQSSTEAGTNTYAFQASTLGPNSSAPNTITTAVTVILGVTTINNPTSYTTLGTSEETDADLKIRRQKSTSISSQGYLAGLLAALENINGMGSAFVYENNTASTDGNSIPSHSIWVIVSGTAAASDIAQAIYTKRNAGCGMFGSQNFTITQVDGSAFIVSWDNVVAETLYIKFNATSIDGVNAPNTAAILAQLPTIFVPGVAMTVNTNEVSTLVQQIDPNTLVTFTSGQGLCATSGGSYVNILVPTAKNNQFAVDASRITITVL